MANKTCSTCEYWVRDNAYKIVGKCTQPKNKHVVTKCSSDIECVDLHLERSEGDPLFGIIDGGNPKDADGYAACMMPGPDFGCIHHENNWVSCK